MELHFKIIGILLIALAFIHVIFSGYFKWKKELSSLSIMNRQMMYVHSYFIAFIVLLMGVLCLVSATDLIETTLGAKICLGLGIFWIARLLVQFFGYSSQIWRGKKFETTIHIIFSVFWIYLSTIFILAFIQSHQA